MGVRRRAERSPAASRVVAAMQDPNPQVAGRGLYRLQQEGIDVSHGLMMRMRKP
ncbi:hypothetical protein ACVXG7_23995 [Enterobacter hormaechei]